MKTISNIIALTSLFSYQVAVGDSAKTTENKCSGKPVVEIVIFNVNKGVTNKEVQFASKNIMPDIKKLKGFESRELVTNKEGKWVDIVHWSSLESALTASQLMMKNQKALSFFSLIDQNSMSMMHLCK